MTLQILRPTSNSLEVVFYNLKNIEVIKAVDVIEAVKVIEAVEVIEAAEVIKGR